MHVDKRTKAIGKLGLQGLIRREIVEYDEQKEIEQINKRIFDQLKMNMFEKYQSETTTKTSQVVSFQ